MDTFIRLLLEVAGNKLGGRFQAGRCRNLPPGGRFFCAAGKGENTILAVKQTPKVLAKTIKNILEMCKSLLAKSRCQHL